MYNEKLHLSYNTFLMSLIVNSLPSVSIKSQLVLILFYHSSICSTITLWLYPHGVDSFIFCWDITLIIVIDYLDIYVSKLP